jgi:hypothetical protein
MILPGAEAAEPAGPGSDRALLAGALEALPPWREKKGKSSKDRLGGGRKVNKLAVSFLRIGPNILASISPAIRPFLIRWSLILADHSRETLIDFLERSRDILAALTAEESCFLLPQGLELAGPDPVVSYQFFVHLPTISREISKDRFSSWFEEGLSLISRSTPAALAYFGLESRQSQERAQEEQSSVSLEEVSRPMKLFAQALTGRILGLRPLQELKNGLSSSAGPLPCTDGETIYLPEVVKEFPTREMNSLAFKLATAHQAGYVEFEPSNSASPRSRIFPPEFMPASGISDKGRKFLPGGFFHLFRGRTWRGSFMSSKVQEWITASSGSTEIEDMGRFSPWPWRPAGHLRFRCRRRFWNPFSAGHSSTSP